jgi:hypothetical protein
MLSARRWLERLRAPRVEPVEWSRSMKVRFREASAAERDGFLAAGYQARHFFPHRWYALQKCGPDGARLAQWMSEVREPRRLWQLLLYATSPAIEEFPDQLFFDPDLNWHQQHGNRRGLAASVSVAVDGGTAYTAAHQSDLVQRVSRNRAFKTRVEKVFQGWHRLLLNAIAGFAADQGLRRVLVPSAQLAMTHTDQSRTVEPELFERVYDRAVRHQFAVIPDRGWWRLELERNRGALAPTARREERLESPRTLCLAHDIERGLGHRDVEPEFAREADREAPAALDRMLEIERRAGVRCTYDVVGTLLEDVRDPIERDGHCLAFHSYDHGPGEQLQACRRVDYRIKGYRPPRSVLTPELSDSALCWHNFEWLASSEYSLGFRVPRLVNRVVRIPILLDDFSMHRDGVSFDEWAGQAIRLLKEREFMVLSLHDCYGRHWLPGYERFLADLKQLARLRTLDEVAADLFMASAA